MKIETLFALLTFMLTLIIGLAYLSDIPKLEEEKGARVEGLVKLDPELKKQLECLAINVYKEAGYESDEGKLAVAQVTLNRVEHRDFPNTVCEVVYQKTRNRHTGRMTTCQFSWYCDPVHRNREVHEPSYQESYQIARQALLKGARIDDLEDALFYHATYINPRWRFERIQTIGLHTFYRIPQRQQYALAK